MPAPTTREQILEYLRLHPYAKAGEIAQALQVTASNVRHHLALLQEAGLVEIAPPEKPTRRGRPAQRYRLTLKAQEAHLFPLTRALLILLHREMPLEEHLDTLCTLLLGETDLPFSGNLRQRLQRLLETLNALGYEAHWEAHHHGPLITLRRCPFAPLRAEFPALCQLDRRMIEYALGREAEQIQSADTPHPGQPAVCRYQIRLL